MARGSACRSGGCPAAAADVNRDLGGSVISSMVGTPRTPPSSTFSVPPRTSAASAPSQLTRLPSPGGIEADRRRVPRTSNGKGGTTITATRSGVRSVGERQRAGHDDKEPGQKGGHRRCSRGRRRGRRRPWWPLLRATRAQRPSQPRKPRRCGSDSWTKASTSTPEPRMSTPPIQVPRSVWHHTVQARTAATPDASGRDHTHSGRRPAAMPRESRLVPCWQLFARGATARCRRGAS